MKNIIVHRADERGITNHGWLHSKHTFSFGEYYQSDRLHFGALRVINDDLIAPGRGFGSHPHSNMEIVTIPLDGELEHKDGNDEISLLKPGDVQIISAGSGMFHNLQNKNKTLSARYLQLWFVPKIQGVKTRVEKSNYSLIQNKLIPLITPELHDNVLWIFQDVWIYLAIADKTATLEYQVKHPDKNGVYVFVMEGSFRIRDIMLNAGDGIGLYDFEKEDEIPLKMNGTGMVLIVEVSVKE
jgi:quercetin 2,3-dioxygenase